MTNATESKNTKGKIIGVLVLLIIIAGGVYYYFSTQKSNTATNDVASEKEVNDLIAKVKKNMLIPESEIPVIFDIEDPQKLISQQVFFNGAQKGDKLLIFSTSSKAIIYSPSRDIIVNSGPINYNNPTASPDISQITKPTTNATTTNTTTKSTTKK